MSESPSGWNGNVKAQIAKVGARNKGQARKPKGKFVKPTKVEAVKKLVPTYLYISECCDALGKKSPVVKRGQDEQKKSPQTLGSFRCSTCNRPAKVRRQLNSSGVELGI